MHRRRNPFDPVVVSTLPHIAAMWIALSATATGPDDEQAAAAAAAAASSRLLYACIVAVSVALSVAWHLQHERRGCVVFWLDYTMAAVWAVADVCMVACLNALTVAANHVCDALARRNCIAYESGHTAWHLLSSVKCVYVAYLTTTTAV